MKLQLTVAISLLAGSSLTAVADDVVLKRSVRIRHDGESVRLADIATLEGDYAMEFGELKITRMTRDARPLEIAVEDVVAALDRAGMNRARLDVSGNRVLVRPYSGTGAAPGALDACVPLKIDEQGDDPGHHQGAGEPGEPTVSVEPGMVVMEDTARGLVATQLGEYWSHLDIPVRIRMKTPRPEVLGMADARPVVRRMGSAGRSSHAFSVQVEGQKAIRVIATIEVNAMAHRATADLKRGSYVSLHDIEPVSEWIPIHERTAVQAAGSMIGLQLDSKVAAGEMLKPYHFEPIVRRNESIKVRSGGRGFTLELDCICLEDGRLGDTIEVRTKTPGRKKRDETPLRVVVVEQGHAEILN